MGGFRSLPARAVPGASVATVLCTLSVLLCAPLVAGGATLPGRCGGPASVYVGIREDSEREGTVVACVRFF